MKNLLLAALFAFAGLAQAAVNINTATQAELEKLHGIGASKAKAIVEYRTKNGPFKSVDDLDKVPGIGQGVLKDIRNDVTLSGPTDTSGMEAHTKKSAAKGEKKATKPEAKPSEMTATPGTSAGAKAATP